jgi:hypothetical protein
MRRIYLSPAFGKIALLFILLISGTSLRVLGQNVPELIYYKFDAPGATTPNLASAPVGTNPAPVTGFTLKDGVHFDVYGKRTKEAMKPVLEWFNQYLQ